MYSHYLHVLQYFSDNVMPSNMMSFLYILANVKKKKKIKSLKQQLKKS